MDVQLEAVYAPSKDVVGREVFGEYIIVPLKADIGDPKYKLYTLNDTGYEIWKRLDGVRSLHAIAEDMSLKYQASQQMIEQDILNLVDELVRWKILVEIDIE